MTTTLIRAACPHDCPGTCALLAEVRNGVATTGYTCPGLVVGLFIWWEALAADGKNANELTSQRLTDMGRSPTFCDVLVEVEETGMEE